VKSADPFEHVEGPALSLYAVIRDTARRQPTPHAVAA